MPDPWNTNDIPVWRTSVSTSSANSVDSAPVINAYQTTGWSSRTTATSHVIPLCATKNDR